MEIKLLNPDKLKTRAETVTTLNDLLVACYGNQTEVARLIGAHRSCVNYKVKNKKNPVIRVFIDEHGNHEFKREWGIRVNKGRK